MAERLSDQEIDAAVCRVAKTHFDDAALIERHMTDLENEIERLRGVCRSVEESRILAIAGAQELEQELSRLRACVGQSVEQQEITES